jgi:hypothetical protein
VRPSGAGGGGDAPGRGGAQHVGRGRGRGAGPELTQERTRLGRIQRRQRGGRELRGAWILGAPEAVEALLAQHAHERALTEDGGRRNHGGRRGLGREARADVGGGAVEAFGADHGGW